MAFLIVRGVFRGFFKEIGSLAGVILGICLASLYQPLLNGLLRSFLPSSKFLPLIGFAAIFIVVFVVCNLMGRGLKTLFKKAFVGWPDRFFGAGLATIKGLIIIYFGIVLFNFFLPSKAPLITKSKLAPFIITSYQSVIGVISPAFYHSLKSRFLGDEKGIGRNVSKKIPSSGGRYGRRQVI